MTDRPSPPDAGSKPRVLVVDSDRGAAHDLARILAREGFAAEALADGPDLRSAIVARAPDLLILELLLAGTNGMELCRALRNDAATRELPIVILSRVGAEADKVRGLSAVAEDYVVKPASIPELVARLRAVLRRSRPEIANGVIQSGDISIDLRSRRVSRRGRTLRLSPREFDLLVFLVERAGVVATRAQILERVWGVSGTDTRTVDVAVGRLRRSLSRRSEDDPVRTVRGEGYMFASKPGG